MTTKNSDLVQAIDQVLDERSLTWAARWIEDSLRGETNERVIEFGQNMAMTLRAARIQDTRVPVDSVAPRVDDADGSLRPEHKCKPLARALMMEGRDWWIGELLEPVSEWPHETHCLHMKTPLKVVSFLCNAGDFEQLLVLSNVVVRLENPSWLRAATASAKVRLLAPFSLGCHECGGSGKVMIGCAIDHRLTVSCASCGGTGRKPSRSLRDYEDKGTPDKEVFDQLVADPEQMPRRYCSVHDREEFKYESLEHELHAAAASPAPKEEEAEGFARQVVGTVFDNTAASHETLKQIMIQRITDAVLAHFPAAESAGHAEQDSQYAAGWQGAIAAIKTFGLEEVEQLELRSPAPLVSDCDPDG